MAASPIIPVEPDLAERLSLAAEALAAYRTRCFWFLSPDFTITTETLPLVIEGLRRHGDRAAFLIAARLCR